MTDPLKLLEQKIDSARYTFAFLLPLEMLSTIYGSEADVHLEQLANQTVHARIFSSASPSQKDVQSLIGKDRYIGFCFLFCFSFFFFFFTQSF